MAIELGSETLTLTKKARTWRVECETVFGSDYTLTAHREIVSLDQNGKVVARDITRPVIRRVSQVMGEADAMQMLGLMKALVDRWAAEDEAV